MNVFMEVKNNFCHFLLLQVWQLDVETLWGLFISDMENTKQGWLFQIEIWTLFHPYKIKRMLKVYNTVSTSTVYLETFHTETDT